MPAPPLHTRRGPKAQPGKRGPKMAGSRKPQLVMDGDGNDDGDDPSRWLGFSLPPRVPQTGLSGPPRRSRRGDAWRGSALTREKFVNASYSFMLKPTEVLSYGAHFADPDIALHWPNILQVLVPTFSSYSVAQGFVSSENELEDDVAGEDAAERRRRIEEERQGRMCPICLSKPVAGRMTKCGHIFCLPCILHYIALSDVPKATTCPICGDTIHEGMLKSVRYLDAETLVHAAQGDDGGANTSPELRTMLSEARAIDESEAIVAEGDAGVAEHPHGNRRRGAHRIHMRLLQRPQMTTLALPPSSTWPSDAIPPVTAPWHFLPDVLTYSHFALATPEYMLHELERELAELKGEWDNLEGDELQRSFVVKARDKVERQVGKVKAELMTDFVRHNEADAREAWGDAAGGALRERERQREQARQARDRAEKEKQDDQDLNVPVDRLDPADAAVYNSATVRVPPNLAVEPNPMPDLGGGKKSKRRKSRSVASTVPATPPAPAQYFYQSSLGAHVFLNPLDSRMLLTQFGEPSSLPPHISFPITGFDSATVTDELRKRVKYLGHLPVGTEVIFVEADLSEIVSAEVLAQFEQPLKVRRDKRRARVRREDREKRRYEEAERAKQPPAVHIVPSALAQSKTTGDMDADLALALERSRLDVAGAEFPSMDSGASPPRVTAPVAYSPPSPVSSFASALRGPASARTWAQNPQQQDTVDGAGVDEAWATLNDDHDANGDASAAGRKKKGNKKGKKLVFGGAGRQA